MPPSRRSARTSGQSGRRGFLLKLGGGVAILVGGGASLVSSDAFTLANADRNAPIDAAAKGDGIVGIVGQGPVKKNSRDPMVEFTNNGSEDIDIQVTLQNCGDGTLYNNDGNSGCSVVVTLPVGNSEFADIDADVTGTIPYDVSVSEVGGSDFQLLTSGTVESEAGNNFGAIRIQKPKQDQDFNANLSQNNWTIDDVDVRDDDGDDDLDEVKFEVSVSGQGVVGSKTVSNPPGNRYNPQGTPAVTINPNAGYTIQSGTQYTLTTTGTDADGNFATTTVDDTTSGSGGGSTSTSTSTPSGCTAGASNNPGALQFDNLQNFTAQKGPDRWKLDQVQVQDADGDDDLNTLQFEITDSGGTVRATRTTQLSGQQYQEQNIKIDPDDPSYDVSPGETYTLTATVCDVDGNARTETRQATA